MKIRHYIFILLGMIPLWSVSGQSSENVPATLPPGPNHPARSEDNLLEIIHHVYLWYYDRSFFTPGAQLESLDVRFRSITHELDEGDNSQFAEIWFPDLKMLIELKRSDYPIEELDLQVTDKFFKIRSVVRVDEPPVALAEYESHSIPRERLRKWFSNKSYAPPPKNEALRLRLRESLLEQEFLDDWDTTTQHIFYIAPISPVSNDLWVLHENTNQLLQFSSDMDLTNPEYWAKTSMRLKWHYLDPAKILAPDGNGDGSAKLSKDFVGRALFNCVVLGRRVEVSPAEVVKFLKERE